MLELNMQEFWQDASSLLAILVFFSILPAIALTATSFLKLSIVFSLIRNAIGVQQIPPNILIYLLALIVSIYIMKPVIADSYRAYESYEEIPKDPEELTQLVTKISKPFKEFMLRNIDPRTHIFFYKQAKKLWPSNGVAKIDKNDFFIVLPAFTTSELTSAFMLGFVIFLPFLVIDLLISNVLLALGMMMVSPMTISLPFKILLFVVVDGWVKIMGSIISSYN